MAPLFCVDITENRNNDRINGCDTELLEQRREDFREQFLWQQLTDLLRQAELVIDQREGKHIYYEINTSVIDEILTWVTSLREGDKT